MYTAHFFPKTQVPANVLDPWKKKNMTDKVNNANLFAKWFHLWICGSQSHQTNR